MNQISTFVRSSGEGDNILCLHSCLGSSKQWCALTDRLEASYRVTATDLFGFGKAPAWSFDNSLRLEDEVKLLAPVLDSMSGPVHLVGHSYGAAVALKLANLYTHKINSVIVYEPVLFTLLFAGGQMHSAASEIFQVVEKIQYNYEAGDSDKAIQAFIEYWSGEGSWCRFSSEQQSTMVDKVAMVLANFEALMSEYNAFNLLKALAMPVHCIFGENSPKTTRQIARIMSETCPNISSKGLSGMGHMGPVTHSDLVNDQIETFLQSQQSYSFKPVYPQAA